MVKLIRKGKKKKGFTLIELVAVVAIIGILAALLVPKITEYIQDAKKTKIVDQARKVVMAVETINTKNDKQIDLATTVTEAMAGTPKKVGGGNFTNSSKQGKEIVKYLDGTLNDVYSNLVGEMTIEKCKEITEGTAEFKVGANGKYATS